MTRWKAASIHLSISLTIGLAAALLIFGRSPAFPVRLALGKPGS